VDLQRRHFDPQALFRVVNKISGFEGSADVKRNKPSLDLTGIM
jgi:hypothetical protein